MIGPFLALVLSVTDGDTFRARVEVWPGMEVQTAVRILGIDTPELHGKCQEEKDAAVRARTRLAALLALGKKVELRQVSLDKFAGRVDAEVMVEGVRISDVMVAEGLARRYTGGARAGWCP